MKKKRTTKDHIWNFDTKNITLCKKCGLWRFSSKAGLFCSKSNEEFKLEQLLK